MRKNKTLNEKIVTSYVKAIEGRTSCPNCGKLAELKFNPDGLNSNEVSKISFNPFKHFLKNVYKTNFKCDECLSMWSTKWYIKR